MLLACQVPRILLGFSHLGLHFKEVILGLQLELRDSQELIQGPEQDGQPQNHQVGGGGGVVIKIHVPGSHAPEILIP